MGGLAAGPPNPPTLGSAPEPPGRSSLTAIAGLFMRAGNLTFGGGHVITATLQRELVNRRRWLTLDQYGLAQSLAKITPGTGILAFCAATAWMLARWRGAFVAVVVASAPSAVFAVVLTWAFVSLMGSRPSQIVLAAVLASAVGMMWAAAWLIVQPMLTPTAWLRTAVMVVGAFVALSRWSVSPIAILAVAALIGAFWSSEEAP